MIVSPFAVATAIALLSQATDGNTFKEIKEALYLSDNKSAIANEFQEHNELLRSGAGNASLLVVNQIYVSKDFQINGNFQELAVNNFRSGVQLVDFSKSEAAGIINRFIEENTNEKIKDLFKAEDLDAATRAVLVNAVHFKGSWIIAFSESSTRKQKFYNGEWFFEYFKSVEVDFMNTKDQYFNYADLDDLDASALQIQYSKSDFSMIFILPNRRTGLSALESKLTDYDLSSVTDEMSIIKMDVSIPKFTVEFRMELNDVLKNVCITFEFFHIYIRTTQWTWFLFPVRNT